MKILNKKELIKDNDLLLFRKPTDDEIEKISRWIETNNISFNRTCSLSYKISIVLALFFLISTVTQTTPSLIFSTIFGIIFIVLSIRFKRMIKVNQNESLAYSLGKFLVLDGYVSKIKSASKSSWKYIWFISNSRSLENGWYSIREETASVGRKVLLVHPELNKKTKSKLYVFSEFMLSDEGYKLH